MKDTAELRATLATAIKEVRAGTMDTDKARSIVRLASQINESFYSEVKVARTQKELGDTKQMAKLGSLPLK